MKIPPHFTLCCLLLLLPVACDLMSTEPVPQPPPDAFEGILFVRKGGGDKVFTVQQTHSHDSMLITVSEYEFRDTLVQFASMRDASTADAFDALDSALHGKIEITGDFRQSTLPTGTWAYFYMVQDSAQYEVTNATLRSRLFPFEKAVTNHFGR